MNLKGSERLGMNFLSYKRTQQQSFLIHRPKVCHNHCSPIKSEKSNARENTWNNIAIVNTTCEVESSRLYDHESFEFLDCIMLSDINSSTPPECIYQSPPRKSKLNPESNVFIPTANISSPFESVETNEVVSCIDKTVQGGDVCTDNVTCNSVNQYNHFNKILDNTQISSPEDMEFSNDVDSLNIYSQINN